MFDISWSELLILGVVTLVFVGPKELPTLMRTLGKYAGVVRRHANEFKLQFDAAMREAELEAVREEVNKMQASINSEVMRATEHVDDASKLARVEPPTTNTMAPVTSSDTSATLAPPMPAPPRGET
ncbi:MAG: twin-arginine translocase subunit TatB [Hyphomicrobium denitrificans]|nr:twin-arginine translocase subunit TatB [Hyphomicrobium denitrificans]